MCYDSICGKGVTLYKYKTLQGMFLSSRYAIFIAVADLMIVLNQDEIYKLQ